MLTFNNPSYEELASKEWLVTNGLGGYASSTLSGANTRRYHGLLVAAFNPPTDRKVLVSKIEEKLITGDGETWLSSNAYPGVIHPQGYQYLAGFEGTPVPKLTYKVDHAVVNKSVFMVHGSNTTIVEYENASDQVFNLELTPLMVFRDYHSLFTESANFDFYFENLTGQQFRIHPHYGSSPLFFSFTKGLFDFDPVWLKNMEYAKEQYRGLDFREDVRSIGTVRLTLAQGEKAFFVFTTEEAMVNCDPVQCKTAETERLESLRPGFGDPFIRDLAVSGDQFLVKRKSSGNHSIIAGYHWFTDWGRDTMIAMRGLTVALGKKEISESIIRNFLKYLDGGMLPNRFPDQGENPEYNTIDATLWLFVVLYEYWEKFDDLSFIDEVFPKLEEIIEMHRTGTRYNIHVLENGLLYGGENKEQLTWMDARIGDHVVTPRKGCPVEINVLWYNALCIFGHFTKLLGGDEQPVLAESSRFVRSFKAGFWNKNGYLNDVVIPGSSADETIRPNQIYAVSLPFSPLNAKEQKAILETVEHYLYTDLGLRSLDPYHEYFKPVYEGDQWSRDTAYHQGTTWSYLWGEYALAYLKVNKFSNQAKQMIRERSSVLENHFYNEGCLHAISEIFDGLEPKEGRGCVQQAWSAGMLLRVFCDPSFENKILTTAPCEKELNPSL